MTALRFYNLDEAFSYRRYCPCKNCEHGLFPETATIKYADNHREVEFDISGNTLAVASHSNEVLWYREHREDHKVYGIGSQSPLIYAGTSRRLHSLSQSGTDLFPVTISCNNCHNYQYIVQVHVSLSERRLTGLVLNSETIVIQDMAKQYRIRNLYTTEKTELEFRHTHLSHFHEPEDEMEIPLIPLNIEDPMRTVERIKKLIVFS